MSTQANYHIFLLVRPSPVLFFSLVLLTQLRYHHNSHSLLSAATIITVIFLLLKQTFNIHFCMQCILYKWGMKHFKHNPKYIACPRKSLSLSLTHKHTRTHTHTQSQIKTLQVLLPPNLVQTVQYSLVSFQHSSRPTIHSTYL